MGITNTISELSKYFYEWHKNKYEEIHNNISSIIEDLKSDINGIKARLDIVENEINNRISTTITTIQRDIETLRSEMATNLALKVDKTSLNTWIQVPLEYCDANGTLMNNVSLYDLKLKVNRDTRIARLTGTQVPCWNTGSKALNEQPVFVKKTNATTVINPSSEADYERCPESSKIFIRIPQQYRPMFHAASSPGRACFFSVYRSDGLLHFTTLIKASYVRDSNLSIMWVYGDE